MRSNYAIEMTSITYTRLRNAAHVALRSEYGENISSKNIFTQSFSTPKFKLWTQSISSRELLKSSLLGESSRRFTRLSCCNRNNRGPENAVQHLDERLEGVALENLLRGALPWMFAMCQTDRRASISFWYRNSA